MLARITKLLLQVLVTFMLEIRRIAATHVGHMCCHMCLTSPISELKPANQSSCNKNEHTKRTGKFISAANVSNIQRSCTEVHSLTG